MVLCVCVCEGVRVKVHLSVFVSVCVEMLCGEALGVQKGEKRSTTQPLHTQCVSALEGKGWHILSPWVSWGCCVSMSVSDGVRV